MEIFDVEANNFEFYFKKIGSITDYWCLSTNKSHEKINSELKNFESDAFGVTHGRPGSRGPLTGLQRA